MAMPNETQDKMSDKNELEVNESDETSAKDVKTLTQISLNSNIGSEFLTVVSHLATLPTQSPPRMPKTIPRNGLIRKLRLDVRYLIYEYLGHSEQTIIITASRKHYGNLTGLVYTCRDLHHEIKKWTKLQPQTALLMHPTFGLYNTSVTSFRVCWIDVRKEFFYQNGMWILHPNSRREQVQRIYSVEEVHKKKYSIERFELWQRGMNLIGSCDGAKINDAIQMDSGLIISVFRRSRGMDWEIPREYREKRRFLAFLLLIRDSFLLGTTTVGWESF
jgi:hypothetical protein